MSGVMPPRQCSLEIWWLNFGPGPRCFVITMDKKTGQTVWQQECTADRAGCEVGGFWRHAGGMEANGLAEVADVSGSCATPLLGHPGNGMS